MAVLIYSDGEKTYKSGTGAVSNSDKKKADQLDRKLRIEILQLEKLLVEEGIITVEGVKNDALQVWYRLGLLLNNIGKQYGVLGTSDEGYYWESIYQYVSPLIQKGQPPKRSKDPRRNHFRLCGYMASKDWDYVNKVGNWAVWRDLLDNTRLQDDPRVFDWVVSAIHGSGAGHKVVRPFIHDVRRSLKSKNTLVLSDDELIELLKPSLMLAPVK